MVKDLRILSYTHKPSQLSITTLNLKPSSVFPCLLSLPYFPKSQYRLKIHLVLNMNTSSSSTTYIVVPLHQLNTN